VCRGSHRRVDLAGDYLDGDRCQQYKRGGHDQDYIS
jgi:hypothetical protein